MNSNTTPKTPNFASYAKYNSEKEDATYKPPITIKTQTATTPQKAPLRSSVQKR